MPQGGTCLPGASTCQCQNRTYRDIQERSSTVDLSPSGLRLSLSVSLPFPFFASFCVFLRIDQKRINPVDLDSSDTVGQDRFFLLASPGRA
jgi:hypothetical protein